VKLEMILDACLEELRQTGDLEACLRRYPDQTDDLRPLLQTALAMMRAPTPPLPAPRKAHDVQALAALVDQQREQSQKRFLANILPPLPWLTAPILRGAVSFAVIVFLFWGAASAIGGSRPGSIFYPFRITLEQAQLAAASNPRARAQSHLNLARRRLQEFRPLATQGQAPLALTVMTEMRRETRAALEQIIQTTPEEAVPLLGDAVALLQDQSVALRSAAANAPDSQSAARFREAGLAVQAQLERTMRVWQDPQDLKSLLKEASTPSPAPTVTLPTATPPPEATMATMPTSSPAPTITLPPILPSTPLPTLVPLAPVPTVMPPPATGAPPSQNGGSERVHPAGQQDQSGSSPAENEHGGGDGSNDEGQHNPDPG